ncbi:acyltransferase [Catenulispora sp. NL8]|uniref:Acyltransferase n=1 Tax=Catenulispora pinistramenti TaxID=2705254 RepID=A0ABS5KQG1_9ACTN|nr:acyltransferase [Catenulispora pinistramenti]MBS2548265.1 acyltransferase [Catenulispora pinistramenti]
MSDVMKESEVGAAAEATATGGTEPGEAPEPAAAPSPVANRPQRLYALDLIRFIAALLVVLRHWVAIGAVYVGNHWVYAWGMAQPKHIAPFLLVKISVYGDLGVQLFFLISGFVICMSSWGRTVGEFGASRISRLYPAYWFSVLGSIAVLLAFPRLGVHSWPGSFHDVLMNLTMTQSFYNVHDIDPVYWTLAAELRFYLLFAIVVFFGVTYRRVVYFCWLWVFVAMFTQITGNGTLNQIVQPQYAPYFIAGVAFFLMWRFGPTMLLWAIVGVSFLIAQSSLTPDPASFPEIGWDYPRWPMFVALVGFFALMTLVSLHKLDWVRWKPLVTLGALTYPLYLLHQDIGFTLIAYLHEHLSFWPTLILALVFILALCYLVQRFVEKPAQRWLSKGVKKSLEAMRRADAGAPPGPGTGGRRRLLIPHQTPASAPAPESTR